MVALAASAQNPFLPASTISHEVRNGDTLERLARHYLGDATLWQGLQDHNQIANPYRLQPGTVIEIPLQLMRTSSASVHYLHGDAQVRRADQSVAAAPGMPLQEGDQLQLGSDAFVTVLLADGSTVQVQAASQLELHQLRRRGRTGSLQSVLEVQEGGVSVQVPGKTDAQRRLDVITPVAATSVRGTVFDVQLIDNGSATASVLQGKVAVQSLAQAQQTTPTATLQQHTGMAVSADGRAGAVTALLPAPPAQELPSLNEDAQWLNLPLPHWAQAQSWRVLVSEDAHSQQVLRNGSFTGDLARFAALPDGHYFLRVRAVDQQGIVGMPTTVPLRVKAHPVAPLALAPAPAGVLPQGEAQLQCTPVDGVVRYRHQVIALESVESAASASAFVPAAFKANSQTQDCALDLNALPEGAYAWRAASVRLVQGQEDQGPFAPAHVFRIAPKPKAPSLNDLSVQTQAGLSTIHWPAEAGQRFRMQAFATPDGTEPALDIELDEPRWTAGGVPAGTWHIRIQAQDPSGLKSAFSPARQVQVLSLVRDSSGQPLSSGYALGVEHP